MPIKEGIKDKCIVKPVKRVCIMATITLFENSVPVELETDRNESFKLHKFNSKEYLKEFVTREEAENLVKEVVSPNAQLIDYHLRPYSEEKLGYLGSHLCLVLDAKQPGIEECEKLSMFVKAMPYNIPNLANYIEEKGIFHKEVNFFKLLLPLLTENFRGECWSPRCFLAKSNCIVFEDMKSKGYSNTSKLFDEKSTKSAVSCIAKFHAASLLAEERLNGKTFFDVYSDLLQEAEFKRTSRSLRWYTAAIDFAVELAAELGFDTSRIREASERVFDLTKPSRNKRNVISHGDLWSNNMMFNHAGHCCLVDFQLIRYAPLAHDLMQLLYLTTSKKFRSQHEGRMIKHYYETLRETLSNNNGSHLLPEYAELLQGVEEQRLPAVVTAVMFHPTVLMDGKTAAVIMDNPETYEAYYFTRRKPFVDRIMAENPEYAWRIKDVVKELAEMALQLDNIPPLT